MTEGSLVILGWALASVPVMLAFVAYAGYPALLKVLTTILPRYDLPTEDPEEWPYVTFLVPVYNEESVIREKLERMLDLDYPRERRKVLVVSDASSDATDEIVREFEDRGVQLVRLEGRSGKTAAENEARNHVEGEVVVNTDATTRIQTDAVTELVRAFQDTSVGVASGRDLSVPPPAVQEGNPGESGYVDYEMWVRSLETDLGGIVGASGCFFAIRAELFDVLVPEALSRDFASPLIAKLHGYRSVSVDSAHAVVPRTRSLGAEFRRKVRTMARGLDTLFAYRSLLNPFRHGGFALKLWAHKLGRWLVPLTLPLALTGLLLVGLSLGASWISLLTFLVIAAVLAGLATWWSEREGAPAAISAAAYLVLSGLAGLLAWSKALRRERRATWEPTRR